MVIRHGDIAWVDFGEPRGSQPAKRRPALVLQDAWLLGTAINTVIVVPLTSNLGHRDFPGNVAIPADASGLDRDSVVLASQVTTVSREHLDPHAVASLPQYLLDQVKDGLRLVMGLGRG